MTIADLPESWDAETEVLIIGAGACGLVAGLAAGEAGAEVLIVERDASPSGSTALSSGFIPAAGTIAQKALEIEDSPELFAADIQQKANDGAHPGITATATQNIGPALDWLAQNHGLNWHVLDDFLYPGHSRHRMHAVPEKTGAGLMARLIAASEGAGLTRVNDAQTTTLHVEGQRILGVTVARPDGVTETIRANAVILACNGYGANTEMVARHIPEIAAAPYFGHPGNTGDAVSWGLALGAKVRDLTAYQGHGSLAHPHGILITWALMMEGGIQVNARGERFSNEILGYSEQGVAVLTQPGGIAWNIYDARLHELGMTFPDYRDAMAVGAVLQGDTAALSERIGIEETALIATLADCAACCDGAADKFGRDFTAVPVLGPDLYAIRVTGALFHTQGGLVVDADARVIGDDGTPFPNLWAGGGAACGVSGSSVEG
ncbi:MAG: FAD-dependent oxidoreductase, partial [Pseudomonadota bacterium]